MSLSSGSQTKKAVSTFHDSNTTVLMTKEPTAFLFIVEEVQINETDTAGSRLSLCFCVGFKMTSRNKGDLQSSKANAVQFLLSVSSKTNNTEAERTTSPEAF